MTRPSGTHLSADEIDSWLAGNLASEWQQHLAHCQECLAVAAGLILILLGSMPGSIAWSLTHPQTLASIGHYLVLQGEQIAWLSLRGVASNLMEQPWYSGLQSLISNPGRLAAGSAVVSSVYLVGILALRRLLALPTQQVAHAGI